MCQCPKRANFISTPKHSRSGLQDTKSVNALNGLTSFLRNFTSYAGLNDNKCQCPKRANFISTYQADSLFKMAISRVNALNGLTSFLLVLFLQWRQAAAVCQCPKRANFISTVPSGNPCKYWLSSLIFAGICQTILKTTVFLHFFGMFIICSYFKLVFCQFLPTHYIPR